LEIFEFVSGQVVRFQGNLTLVAQMNSDDMIQETPTGVVGEELVGLESDVDVGFIVDEVLEGSDVDFGFIVVITDDIVEEVAVDHVEFEETMDVIVEEDAVDHVEFEVGMDDEFAVDVVMEEKESSAVEIVTKSCLVEGECVTAVYCGVTDVETSNEAADVFLRSGHSMTP